MYEHPFVFRKPGEGEKDKKSYGGNAMDQKRALVDTMFKYLDLNADGRLGSSELAQVGTHRGALGRAGGGVL